jgi:hypothetical protein
MSDTPLQARELLTTLPSCPLAELEVLARWFGMSRRRMSATLRALKVPILNIGDSKFCNQMALDKHLYYVTSYRGYNGFAAPGTRQKLKKRKTGYNSRYMTEITDDDIQAMKDPLFIAEWLATGPNARLGGKALIDMLRKKPTKKEPK